MQLQPNSNRQSRPASESEDASYAGWQCNSTDDLLLRIPLYRKAPTLRSGHMLQHHEAFYSFSFFREYSAFGCSRKSPRIYKDVETMTFF